jgi:hypothetical protein
MPNPDQLNVPELLNEIKHNISKLEMLRPRQLDANDSARSKLPFKAMWATGCLHWRMAELSRAAMEAIEIESLASAMILTRAVVETFATLWSLESKIRATVEANECGEIDKHLTRFVMGHRNNEQMPMAINVMTCIDHVEKQIDGFRRHYDVLSEYAHPNWAGTTLIYSQPVQGERTVQFGRNIRGIEATIGHAVISLSTVLLLFMETESSITNAMPEFIQVCEDSISTGQ